MSPLTGQGNYTPIGIAGEDSVIHAVQFRLVKGRAHLRASVSQPVQSGETSMLPALKALVHSGAFVGRSVVSALPSDDVIIRPLLLPAGVRPGDDSFTDALMLEARSALLYSPDEAVLDHLPLGVEVLDEQERHALLLIATKKECVHRHLALLRAAGLNCIHLDVAPCATARVFGADPSIHAIVDMGGNSTTVSVAEGSKLLFSRIINLGVLQMVEELARALEIKGDEARYLLKNYGIEHSNVQGSAAVSTADSGVLDPEVIRITNFEVCSRVIERYGEELKRSFEYFSRQRRGGAIQKAFLLGSLMPLAIENYLSETTSVPFAVGDPFDGVNVPAGYSLPARGSFTTAVGLALRGVGP